MNNSLQQPELQLRTLRLYGELLCRQEDWSRRLVLAAFPGASGTGIAAAASLAGAVSLTVDIDAVRMKEHFRDGAFDFVVNTLDEALRAVKNEIRRGNPLAIGLTSEPDAALSEAAERGLGAEFILFDGGYNSAVSMQAVSEISAAQVDVEKPSSKLEHWLKTHGWSLAEIPSMKMGMRGERSLPDVLHADDRIRRKWLRDLSTNQRSVRQGSRWVWLSDDEKSRMQGLINPG